MAARVEVVFAGDTRKLDGAFKRVQGETTKTESRFAKLKGLGGPAMFAGAAIGIKVLGDAFQGLKDDAAATAAVKSSIESMGRVDISTDSIDKWASAVEMSTGKSAEELKEMSAVMATFGNVTGENFTRASDLAVDMSQKFGQDLSSSAVQLGKALQDPIAGISALSRVGVQFTEAQKGQIAAMVEAGDVAGAQTLIMDELSRQVGGAAAAYGDTLPGKLDIAKAKFGELTEKGVATLMPAMEKAIDFAFGLMDAWDRMPGPAKAVVGAIAGITAALWVLHAHPIVAAVTLVIGALILLEDQFGFVTKSIDATVTAFNWLRDKAIGALQALLTGAITAIGGIVGAAASVADAMGFDGMAENLRGAQDKLYAFRDAANTALDGIKDKTVTVDFKMVNANIVRKGLAWAEMQGDGPGGPMAPGGGSALSRVKSILPDYPGLRITSTYRSPVRNRAAGGSPTSYHLDRNNPAVDIGGPTYQLDRFHAALGGGWREKLWRTKGHWDHVHVAHLGGMVDSSWPTVAGLRSDERPVIAQVGERIVRKGAVAGVTINSTYNVRIDGEITGATERKIKRMFDAHDNELLQMVKAGAH